METLDKDSPLFGKTTFSDISKSIYTKSNKRSVATSALIEQLTGLISKPSDATFVVPLINDLMATDTKAIDLQVKLLTVLQRLIAVDVKTTGGSGNNLTEFELDELLKLRSASEDELALLEERNSEEDSEPLLELKADLVKDKLKKMDEE